MGVIKIVYDNFTCKLDPWWLLRAMGAYGRRFAIRKKLRIAVNLRERSFTTTVINVLTGNSRIKK